MGPRFINSIFLSFTLLCTYSYRSWQVIQFQHLQILMFLQSCCKGRVCAAQLSTVSPPLSFTFTSTALWSKSSFTLELWFFQTTHFKAVCPLGSSSLTSYPRTNNNFTPPGFPSLQSSHRRGMFLICLSSVWSGGELLLLAIFPYLNLTPTANMHLFCRFHLIRDRSPKKVCFPGKGLKSTRGS